MLAEDWYRGVVRPRKWTIEELQESARAHEIDCVQGAKGLQIEAIFEEAEWLQEHALPGTWVGFMYHWWFSDHAVALMFKLRFEG